jgi:dUTP pyrophosphatase
MLEIEICRLPHAPPELPAYASAHASGMDIRLAGDAETLKPGERRLLPTGFQLAIPPGFEGQIRMRSGLALRSGLILPNAPATIDADYRGELKVIVMNPTSEAVTIETGERFAQLVICPVARATLREVSALSPTDRGSGGFGSSGR